MINIPVRKSEKSIRIGKELREQLKELRLLKMVSFMRKELVFCPLKQEEIAPIYCLVCSNFGRRVKGFIYCNAA